MTASSAGGPFGKDSVRARLQKAGGTMTAPEGTPGTLGVGVGLLARALLMHGVWWWCVVLISDLCGGVNGWFGVVCELHGGVFCQVHAVF